MKKQTYKSDILAVVHQTAEGMYKAGAITKQTMRDFNEGCLTPLHEFGGEEIRQLREREEVSQIVFARYLGVTKDTVSKWERGEKRPLGSSLKLLCLIEKNGISAIA